jgi:hypothetical protein
MTRSGSESFKEFLSVIALALSLATLQSPLWRPGPAPHCVTAKSGGTALVTFDGELDKATIFQRRTATLSTAGPGQIMVHGREPGKTSLIIRCKDGNSTVYDVVILPG